MNFNFINQLKKTLQQNKLEQLEYILSNNLNNHYFTNDELYIVCFALNKIKNFKKSNKLISQRSKQAKEFILNKKFSRLEIFNHFYLNNKHEVLKLSVVSLEKIFDPEVVKIFYLSLKIIDEYLLFIKTVSKSTKKNLISDKDGIDILNFFKQHKEVLLENFVLLNLIRRNPTKDLMQCLAINYFKLKKYKLAKKYFEKLIKLNSINEYCIELVTINNILRNKDDAEKYLKLAIDNNKNDLKVIRLSHQMNLNPINDDLLVEKLSKSKYKSDDDRAYNYFYIGKLYEKKKNYKESFNYYSQANSIKNAVHKFNINQTIQESLFFLQNFNDKSHVLKAKKLLQEPEKKIPIFILGLPRSGTTLVEHIFGSHSEVQHFGERDFFFKNFKFLFDVYNLDNNKKIFENFSCEDYLKYGNFYKNNFYLYSGKNFFTDKMPFNYLYLGLIKYSIPNAKIILCKRDYRDVGLSIYKNFFAEDVNFAYEQHNIINYIKQYDKTINSWIDIFGEDIFQIDYNNLILNPKNNVSNMLKYCGLPWEDNCLEFYKKKLIADTVSVSQVTNPLYKNSIDNWKNYYEFLKDFFDSLESIK